MSIQCEDCGEIPLNYVTIENRDLCIRCAKNLYKLRLKELNEQFSDVKYCHYLKQMEQSGTTTQQG